MFILINSDQGEYASDRFFPVVRVHFLNVNIHLDFKAGVAHMGDQANEFNDGAGRYWFCKIYSVTAHGHHFLAAKSRRRYEGNLIHKMHGCPPKKGIVMIGSIRKYSFKDPCFRTRYPFFKCHRITIILKYFVQFEWVVVTKIPASFG